MIWPTARSTSLGGAMTALADDCDAAYWNPGGLGFRNGVSADASWTPFVHPNIITIPAFEGGWLPGLYPGMRYAYASGGAALPFHSDLLRFHVGANITYMSTGETDVINEQGQFLGRYTTWDGAFGAHAGLGIGNAHGVGANLKVIYSYLVPDWVWDVMPELGIEAGGTGTSFAVDVGYLFKPGNAISAGVALANLGPDIAYTSSGESDHLPTMLRMGLCITPCDDPVFRLRILPEVNKLLVGMFYDEEGTKSVGQLLSAEWRDAWKSLGLEATLLQLVTLRLGYFEDLSGARGGIVLKREGAGTEHVGLWDVLTRKNLGDFKSVGICWGIGLGYKDYFRLDFSSDAAIYDFNTQNWKVALSIHDLQGALNTPGQSKLFDWLR